MSGGEGGGEWRVESGEWGVGSGEWGVGEKWRRGRWGERGITRSGDGYFVGGGSRGAVKGAFGGGFFWILQSRFLLLRLIKKAA